MTQLDRRCMLGTMLGAAAVVGAVGLTATGAAALTKPLPAPGLPAAGADQEGAPLVHQARWWWGGRRRVYGVRRRRRWWW